MSALVPRVNESTVVHGIQNATFTATPTVPQTPTYFFSLSNASIGSGFYDQYKIDAIRFNLRPNQNAIGLTTNTTTTTTDVYCVIDYDDANVLPNISTAESYSNCVVVPPGKSLSRTFRPRLALAAYAGTFTGFANVGPQWLDAASPGVQHYGIKLYVPGVTAAQTQLQSWNVIIEYFISLRKTI
jgi:hypothetical protein